MRLSRDTAQSMDTALGTPRASQAPTAAQHQPLRGNRWPKLGHAPGKAQSQTATALPHLQSMTWTLLLIHPSLLCVLRALHTGNPGPQSIRHQTRALQRGQNRASEPHLYKRGGTTRSTPPESHRGNSHNAEEISGVRVRGHGGPLRGAKMSCCKAPSCGWSWRV